MTRVDLLLDPKSNKTNIFQCLIPDEFAVVGTEINVKLDEDMREAKVYNVLPPLPRLKLTHP
jgi:hypothetical protein